LLNSDVLTGIALLAILGLVWIRMLHSQVRLRTRELAADIAGRTKSEAALRESEEWRRAILDTAMDGFWIADMQGRILEVNETYCRMSGYGAQELLAMRIPDVEIVEAAGGTLARIQQIAAQGELRFESQHRRKDGSLFEVEVSVQCRPGENGRLVAFLRDITGRKSAEQELSRGKALLEAIFNGIPDPVIYVNVDRQVVAINPAFTSALGYAIDELAGKSAAVVYEKQEEYERQGRLRFNLTAPEQKMPYEANYRRKDGSVFQGETVGTVIKDASGSVLGYIGVIRDITERKHAEADVRTLSRAMEQSPASILITDKAGNIEYVNPRFEQLTGYTRAEAVGSNPRILKSGITPAETYRQMWQAISDGGEWRGELCNRRKNGELFWEFAAVSGLRGEDGEIEHYIAVKEDITERKQAEAARDSLEAQLRESQKMEAIGTLAGGIAHDLNNALATILGNTELARQDMSANPLALESLEEIGKAGARARDLVQQILAFSRRQSTERRPMALAPVVEESARLLRAALPARVALEVRCEADVPTVLADASQIQQVLINLCNNAVQAMRGEPGRVGIRLDTVRLDAELAGAHPDLRAMLARHPGRAARLAVSDDGPGMDADTLGRIFEPFFTTKPTGEGTGLGLSIVHGVVKGHEGAILIDSQPGKGATFTLYFPAAAAQSGALRREDSAVAETSRMGRGQRILYIDDDESLVFLVERLLERRGFRVSGYVNQREALDALRADPRRFDLVVTDYNMPGMSGLDVAREVRAVRADLPVAVVSGFISEELRKQAGGAGVRELIFKTDTVEELCEAFARLADASGEEPTSCLL